MIRESREKQTKKEAARLAVVGYHRRRG